MFKIVPTSSVGILQTFGKFTRKVDPGIRFYVPLMQRLSVVSTRLQQETFKFNVKTRDDVFATLGVSVQFRISEADAERAFFALDKPIDQMDAYIENIVRSTVPTLTLDELFAAQDRICTSVAQHVTPNMQQYGYTIQNTLITTVEPDSKVKTAMNEINAAERLKKAAQHRADADYIEQVRKAEAARERSRLYGEGISLQRLAILDGYQKGVDAFAQQTGMSAQEIMRFVTEMQRLDTNADISKSTNAKTIFLDYGALKDTLSWLAAHESAASPRSKPTPAASSV